MSGEASDRDVRVVSKFVLAVAIAAFVALAVSACASDTGSGSSATPGTQPIPDAADEGTPVSGGPWPSPSRASSTA